mgnify:CR=1 FL=1
MGQKYRPNYWKNAALLTGSDVVLRLAGLGLRIGLANALGGEGMGLYQLVLAVYGLFVTLATAGISVAATRLLTEELSRDAASARGMLRRLLALGAGLGVLAMAAQAGLAGLAAKWWLGDVRAAGALRLSALGLPWMAVSAVLRGFFLARRRVGPNVASQLAEQTVRIGAVAAALYATPGRDAGERCTLVLGATALSEAVSCTLMALFCRGEARRCFGGKRAQTPPEASRRLWDILWPVEGGRVLASALHTAENMLVPACLAVYLTGAGGRAAALERYGVLKGMALPLLTFPFGLLGSLAVLLMPEITQAHVLGQTARLTALLDRMLRLTGFFSALAAALFWCWGPDAAGLLYGSAEAGFYLQVLAPVLPLLYLESMVDGAMKGVGEQKAAFRYSVWDAVLRLAGVAVLLPRYGMRGFLAVMLLSTLYTCTANTGRLLFSSGMPHAFRRWLGAPALAGALAAKRRTQLEALDASLAAADTALAVLVDAPTRQLALQNQAAQLEARSTALDALAQRLADSQKQARQARRAQDAYRAAAARQDEARARRDALDRAFLDAQAGLLAQELTEGAPCPVCGSTHHPARAVLPRTAPTQVQVEQARQVAEEADRAAQTASAAAQSALAAADEARRSLRRDAEALLPERFAAPEGKPPVQLTFALMNTVLSEETAALQAARTDCTASLRQAGADCQRKAQLEADRQAHTRQRPALEQQVQEADRTAAAQSARVQALEQQVLAKQKALPYPQRAQAQAALDLLEADRTALRAGMEQAEAALRTAQQNYAAAKAAVDALRSQQAAAQSSAPAQPLETLREAAAELTAARDAARGQEKQLAARLLPNRRIMEQYRTAAAQHAALEQRAQWVGALAATAGGTLTSKQKIKLEAYIQMDYLDRILRHANLRLMQMTDAQYELERIGAENQRSQSGLDLGVIDHYNGTRRSVKTLSGGESFKASLALALGLSDEVQSAAGGIRLDTLFLDEGFGSLDEESLEQAIRVLAGLTEGDRLVGIISHVGALKDRIDRQVVVHKNRTGGSTVELVV